MGPKDILSYPTEKEIKELSIFYPWSSVIGVVELLWSLTKCPFFLLSPKTHLRWFSQRTRLGQDYYHNPVGGLVSHVDEKINENILISQCMCGWVRKQRMINRIQAQLTLLFILLNFDSLKDTLCTFKARQPIKFVSHIFPHFFAKNIKKVLYRTLHLQPNFKTETQQTHFSLNHSHQRDENHLLVVVIVAKIKPCENIAI